MMSYGPYSGLKIQATVQMRKTEMMVVIAMMGNMMMMERSQHCIEKEFKDPIRN